MNWLAYNNGARRQAAARHQGADKPFLMYINAEADGELRDELEPDSVQVHDHRAGNLGLGALPVSALLAASVAAHGAELKRWPGGETPALELEDMTGQVRRLADYKGKVVLVNFWATWCEPCRAEMPSIDGLRSAMEGKPFQVLAVNLAEPVSRIEKFIGMMPLHFPLLRDRDGAVAKAWKARFLPASYLIGRDGRISTSPLASSTGRARRCARASRSSSAKELPYNPEQRSTLRRRRKKRPAIAQRMLQLPIKRGVVLRRVMSFASA